MPRCSILMCKNDSRSVNVSHGGVSYHRFPKEPHIKEKWIEATGRTNWFPLQSNTICSEHFDSKAILYSKKGYKYMSDTAVPTRNFLSYHTRTPAAEAGISRSDEEEVELPLEHIKVEATAGPSRKRSTTSSTESTPTKAPKVTVGSDDDSESSDHELKSMMRYEKDKIKKQKIKMQRLENKLKRLKMTISDMEDLYTVLEEKRLMSMEDIMMLRNTEVEVSELVARRQTSKQLSEVVSKLTYSPELRCFALTLHVISAKAYDYVRQMFKTGLPHPRTLKHWYLKTDGEPGFTKEAFVALKRKADASDQVILATLVVADMELTRRVEVDGKVYGYVDMGTGLDTDMLDEAREVLVLSVTAINGSFSVPVAYFLTSNVTSEQRAALVMLAVEMAHDAGIVIAALSADASHANVNMIRHLGYNYEKGGLTFKHPVNDKPIVAILDPSDLLKYFQATLSEFGIFIDNNGDNIDWKYIKRLVDRKHTTNTQYVDYQRTRYGVKQALELFSPKIVEGIQYCRADLELETFKDSEPTVQFLTLCKSIYEVFYSTNPPTFSYKNYINEDNADEVFNFLSTAFKNINAMKMPEGGPIGPGLKHYLTFVPAIKVLYSSLVQSNILQNLPLCKLSQDPLKRLLWNIKVDAGCKSDADPTPKKFILGYKKVVEQIKAISKSRNPALEQLSIPRSPSPVDRLNWVVGLGYVHESKLKADPIEKAIDLLSFKEDVVIQCAVHIIRQLIRKINCDLCSTALLTKKRRPFDNIIVAMDEAQPLYPSPDVLKICRTTETYLKGFDGKQPVHMVKSLAMTTIMRQFIGTNIFDDMSYHQVDEFPESNHVTDLIKAIVEMYAQIFCKLREEKETYKDVLNRLRRRWSVPAARARSVGPDSIFFSSSSLMQLLSKAKS